MFRSFDKDTGLLSSFYTSYLDEPWKNSLTTISYAEIITHDGKAVRLPVDVRWESNTSALPTYGAEAKSSQSSVMSHRYEYYRVNDPALDREEAYSLEWVSKQMSLRFAEWIQPTPEERELWDKKTESLPFIIAPNGMYAGPRSRVVGPEANKPPLFLDWEADNKRINEEYEWGIHPSQLVPYSLFSRFQGEALPGETPDDRKILLDSYEMFEQQHPELFTPSGLIRAEEVEPAR